MNYGKPRPTDPAVFEQEPGTSHTLTLSQARVNPVCLRQDTCTRFSGELSIICEQRQNHVYQCQGHISGRITCSVPGQCISARVTCISARVTCISARSRVSAPGQCVSRSRVSAPESRVQCQVRISARVTCISARVVYQPESRVSAPKSCVSAPGSRVQRQGHVYQRQSHVYQRQSHVYQRQSHVYQRQSHLYQRQVTCISAKVTCISAKQEPGTSHTLTLSQARVNLCVSETRVQSTSGQRNVRLRRRKPGLRSTCTRFSGELSIICEQRQSHMYQRQGHVYQRQGHVYQRQSHGYQRQGHVYQRQSHVYQRQSHVYQCMSHV
ncbi:hypothetical protein WMY93_020913 [Mugilogobius chulae]|uniref:Uncharacterized protein n=1 Tax=Mugilogobius chulae TaxID=88201 RepID=A0AAW0NGA9_9GOBI